MKSFNLFSNQPHVKSLKLWLIFLLAGNISCDLERIDPVISPKASFFYSHLTADCKANCDIKFTNTSSSAESYLWHFDDGGTTSSEKDPVHTYVDPGTYNVRLQAFVGEVVDDTTLLVVIDGGLPPTACFDFSNDGCVAPCAVSFTNCSENAQSYEWDFKDGSSLSEDIDPIHTFSAPGTYHVLLTAFNSSGTHDTTLVVAINAPGDPVADFTVANDGCTGACTVNLTNTSSGATSYTWDFGDPASGAQNTSTDTSPSHVYQTGGIYEITLTATGPGGSNQKKKSVTINSAVNREFFSHEAAATNINAQLTTLNNVNTNNNPDKILVVTPVLGVQEKSPLGLYYAGNRWSVFKQDVTNIPVGLKLNVLVADVSDPKAFVHTTSGSNLRESFVTTIDHAATNDRNDARVFVTPVWEKASDYNNHPVGVVYTGNQWEIVNLDKSPLPENAKFNVIVSEDNQTSFVHTSTAASTISYYSRIDDPKTNNKSGASLFLIPNLQGSTNSIPNPRTTGLWYISGSAKWSVFNQDAGTMPDNVSFNIMVLE